MSGAEMHLPVITADSATSPPMTACQGCGALFAPRRGWQRFCSKTCRSDYHQANDHEGTVKRISKTKHGWSWTIHMSDGDWAQLGDTVQLVRR